MSRKTDGLEVIFTFHRIVIIGKGPIAILSTGLIALAILGIVALANAR
ncbi:hypothetical protein ACYCVF_07450 [Bradyrhizobium sp. 1.29L]